MLLSEVAGCPPRTIRRAPVHVAIAYARAAPGAGGSGVHESVAGLSDAASALDWAQTINPEARACWIAGVSFGSWIGMQLLMRRPEIEGFISIAPPANRFDFSFLAPCPSSGLFVHGDKDRVAPLKEVQALIEKLKTQKGILIEHAVIPEANHFFEDCMDELQTVVGAYLDKRLGMPRHAPPSVRKDRAKPVAPPRESQ